MDIHNINFILRPFSEKLGIIFCIRERASELLLVGGLQISNVRSLRYGDFHISIHFFHLSSTVHIISMGQTFNKTISTWKRFQFETEWKNCILSASMKLVRKNITNLSVTLVQKKKRCKCHIKAKKGKWSQFWFWNCFYYTLVYDTQNFNNRKNLWLSQLWLKPSTKYQHFLWRFIHFQRLKCEKW